MKLQLAMGGRFFTMRKISNCSNFPRTVVDTAALVTWKSHLEESAGPSCLVCSFVKKVLDQIIFDVTFNPVFYVL